MLFLDYLAVGSDSGRIVILEYLPAKNCFEKVHQETFGKSGCRRIVPGQYLAADPKGRAIMIGINTKQYVAFFMLAWKTDVKLIMKIMIKMSVHYLFLLVFGYKIIIIENSQLHFIYTSNSQSFADCNLKFSEVQCSHFKIPINASFSRCC